MFKKNDPLIDSVKAIMERNAIERQAEAAVNEEFGITSKNALPHEYRAAYEQRLAEAKKCAMEELKGDQHKIDVANKKGELKPDGQLSKHDFKMLRAKKKTGLEEKWKEELEEKKDFKLINPALEKKAKEKKIEEEEQLDELSKNTLRKYLVQTNWIKKDPGLMHDDRVAVGKKYAPGRKLASKKLRQKLYKTSKAGKEERKRKILDINEQQLDEKATEAQQSKVEKVMKHWKKGEQHIGKSKKTVPVSKEGQKQAVAIALSMSGLSKKKKKQEELEEADNSSPSFSREQQGGAPKQSQMGSMANISTGPPMGGLSAEQGKGTASVRQNTAQNTGGGMGTSPTGPAGSPSFNQPHRNETPAGTRETTPSAPQTAAKPNVPVAPIGGNRPIARSMNRPSRPSFSPIDTSSLSGGVKTQMGVYENFERFLRNKFLKG